jgi:hypothetical protein
MAGQKRQERLWSNKAQTWEYIENRFVSDFGGRHFKMIELIQHIRSSGLAYRLFAYSSMDKLVISIYETIDPRKDALHINFDLVADKWYFLYHAKPYTDPEFEKTYPSEKGIEKFDKFVDMIRW